MHIYNAMNRAKELWGDDARVRQEITVHNDGRMNLQFEVGYHRDNGERQWFGGGSFEAAFESAEFYTANPPATLEDLHRMIQPAPEHATIAKANKFVEGGIWKPLPLASQHRDYPTQPTEEETN